MPSVELVENILSDPTLRRGDVIEFPDGIWRDAVVAPNDALAAAHQRAAVRADEARLVAARQSFTVEAYAPQRAIGHPNANEHQYPAVLGETGAA